MRDYPHLLAAWAKGRGLTAIAAQYGVSRSSVWRHLCRARALYREEVRRSLADFFYELTTLRRTLWEALDDPEANRAALAQALVKAITLELELVRELTAREAADAAFRVAGAEPQALAAEAASRLLTLLDAKARSKD